MRVMPDTGVVSITSLVDVPFDNGDHLDQKTFHELYLRTPEEFHAELIGGVVYFKMPTKASHGRPHARVVLWLGTYAADTPGTEAYDATTNILGRDSEPEPDAMLLLDRACGGQTRIDDEDYLTGPPELIVEVANSSTAIDLGMKKRDYERAGVLEYVVVRVRERSVVWYSRQKKKFVELPPGGDGVFRSALFPGLWLAPNGLFAGSPTELLQTLRSGLASAEHAALVRELSKRLEHGHTNGARGKRKS